MTIRFDPNAPLIPGTRLTAALVFSGTDPSFTAAANGTIADSTPGVNSSGYPGYQRATGTGFITAGFRVGQYVRVTGSAADANGSNAAPKVWRIAYLTETFMGVEGPGAASIADAATQSFTIRRVRVFGVAMLRSVQGAAHPITLQATTSNNLNSTTVHASLDGGVTWDAVPGLVLPDADNSNAKILQFFAGYEALLMVVPAANFTGKIYAG